MREYLSQYQPRSNRGASALQGSSQGSASIQRKSPGEGAGTLQRPVQGLLTKQTPILFPPPLPPTISVDLRLKLDFCSEPRPCSQSPWILRILGIKVTLSFCLRHEPLIALPLRTQSFPFSKSSYHLLELTESYS